MTVSTNLNRVEYLGDGTSDEFTTPQFLANSHLKVYVDGTLQALTTDYTLTGAGAASGTATFVSAPDSGAEVVILNDPPITQETDWVENDSDPAAAKEDAFDKLTLIAQRQADRIGRAIMPPDSDVAPDMELPAAASRASKYLVFDANGDVSTSSGTGADAGLRADLASTDSGKGAELVANAYRIVNAADFGADSGNSASANTTALENAYAAAYARKLSLLLPPGNIPIESLTWDKDVSVFGYGQSAISSNSVASVLAPTGDYDGITITGNHAAHYMNFAVDGNAQTGTNFGIQIFGAARSCFQNILAYRCTGVGIHILSEDPISTSNNNRSCYINVRAVSNGGDGWYISGDALANNNSLVFINCSASNNSGKGWNNSNGVAIHLAALSCENNAGDGVYLGGAVRGVVGTVYVEGNGGTNDILFDTNAHSNFLTTINDGAGYTDNNGTNSICIAGSGGTQRYKFNTMDFETFRVIDTQYIGGLALTHDGDRDYSLTQQSGGTGTVKIAKGAGAAINLRVEGNIGVANAAANTNTPSGATAYALAVYDYAGNLLGYMPVYASQW